MRFNLFQSLNRFLNQSLRSYFTISNVKQFVESNKDIPIYSCLYIIFYHLSLVKISKVFDMTIFLSITTQHIYFQKLSFSIIRQVSLTDSFHHDVTFSLLYHISVVCGSIWPFFIYSPPRFVKGVIFDDQKSEIDGIGWGFQRFFG